MDQSLKCGFCKMGKEVENICGRLWQDDIHKCTAHQRCMQYSAMLSQYKMDKFGGFKVKEVIREQTRGKKLKCSICHRHGKSSKGIIGGSASAGCAIQKCKKTFHFYCAHSDEKALSRRIITSDHHTMVMYRVFCSKEHEELFLEPGMKLSEDSDNECSTSAESEEGQDETEHQKEHKKEKVNNGPERKIQKLKRKKADSELDNKDSPAHAATPLGKTDTYERVQKSKRRKLDKEDTNSETVDQGTNYNKTDFESAYVVCFAENSRNIPPTKFENLVNKAKELFGVEASNIFMWKYDTERFTCQHMLLLIIEVAKALKEGNQDRLYSLLCLFGNKDIDEFDDQISSAGRSSSKKDYSCKSLRKNISNLSEEVNAKFNETVLRYCTVESLDSAQVAYLVLVDATDSVGNTRRHMKQSYTLGRSQDQDKNKGNCEKTLSVHALDLGANLFDDVKNHDVEVQESSSTSEEAKIISNWFRDEASTIEDLEVFPKDPLLLSKSPLAAVDHLYDRLVSIKADGTSNPVAIIVKPLDGDVVIASEYLRRCISEVIDRKLTSQHDVYIFIGVRNQNVHFKRVSQFLPDWLLCEKSKIGTKAYKIGSGSDCSIVLHLWIIV